MNLIYTGFTSLDKFNPGVIKKYNSFLHVAGKSPFKGTENLLKIWLKHPEWPELLIIARDYIGNICKDILSLEKVVKNITLINDMISNEKLSFISNSCGVHICCSRHEGFGHYLHEAKSVGSVILYTDGGSMKEDFIPYENGIPIECEQKGFRNNEVCPVYDITEYGLIKAVEFVINSDKVKLEEIGKKARETYLKNQEIFKNNLRKNIKGNGIPKKIHMIWLSKDNHYKNVEMPKKYEKYNQSWKDKNKECEFFFWSGEHIFKLLEKYFPDFISFYEKLPLICKCDFARFVVIYIHGGFYTDLDFMCRKSIIPLMECENYFIFEPKIHFKHLNGPGVSNGIFGSVAKSKLILGWLYCMKNKKFTNNVLKYTGPIGLYAYLKGTTEKVLYGNVCDLMCLNDKGEYIDECKNKYNNYAVTVWKDGSDWGNDYTNKEKFYEKIENPINGKLLIFHNTIEMEQNKNKDYKNILEIYKTKPKILNDEYEAIFISSAVDDKVYYKNNDNRKCEFVEIIALLNSLENLIILN
jgi:mannosyltransferase OCH1-like enzyme